VSDLAAFAAARLDERQKMAGEPRTWKVAHHDCREPQWDPCTEDPCSYAAECAEGSCGHRVIEGSDGMTIYDEGGHTEAEAALIAAHDPAWVPRDVAAKRAILDLYARTEAARDECEARIRAAASAPAGTVLSPAWARDHVDAERELRALEPVVLALAAIDSDHADYDPGWAVP